MVGLIVTISVPEPTISLVTSNCSTKVLSAIYSSILPAWEVMFSLKVRLRLVFIATSVALSKGDKVSIVGFVSSAVEKFHVELSEIPANELPAVSSKADASIFI